MSTKWIVLGVVVLLVVIVLLGSCSAYNSLVTKSQAVDNAWADVQTQYQRRYDLIPNLVETVKGSANFEKSTLEAVIDARASVGRVTLDAKNAPADAAKLEEFQKAQGQLGSALSRLLVVAERYPELKSTKNFSDLQAQLEGTENRISVARRDFNEAVRSYNTSTKTFPSVIFANMFGFREKPYFNATESAQSAPAVRFDFSK